MNQIDLLAIRIERRRIAVAAFSGLRLDYAQVRELSSFEERATRSAREFTAWVAETLEPRFVAIEKVDAPDEARRSHLAFAVTRTIRFLPLAHTSVPAADVLDSLGAPPIPTKGRLRVIGALLWPELAGRVHPAALDAAALGLHLQMTALLHDQ